MRCTAYGYFPRAAREPAYNNGSDLRPDNFERPLSNASEKHLFGLGASVTANLPNCVQSQCAVDVY
jgi:hypothetical protein